ncbi:pilus assembly protein TadG-related protein [Dactylosporangium sp. CS-047395]|uniref:pilus assembly protein TadG-related protein n=1 Tax=Dactylosporangium sp. CS-047395 TaxID=3239936 RepID=UPI003D8AA152
MRRLNDDRGAVVTIFAMLLSAGVLLGAAALVVDVGAAYDEREQLTGGADAASWAAAQYCIANSGCTDAQKLAAGTALANANARDNKSGLQVCGSYAPAPSTCGAMTARSTSNLRSCMGTDPTARSFVRVTTTTLGSTGATTAPTSFTGAIKAKPASPATCSRVEWSPAAQAPAVMAFGIDSCSFGSIVNGGTPYQPVTPTVAHVDTTTGAVAPAKGVPSTGTGPDTTIRAYSVLSGACSVLGEGGFAWFTPTSGCLRNDVAIGKSVVRASNSAACVNAMSAAIAKRTPVLIPVYQAALLSSSYQVVGFAAFVVTGYLLTGYPAQQSATIPPLLRCVLTDCVYGYFTKGLIPVNAKALPATVTADFGVEAIARTG